MADTAINLLNPGAATDVSNWTNSVGTLKRSTTRGAAGTSSSFYSDVATTAYQDVALTAGQLAVVTNGVCVLGLLWYYSRYTSSGRSRLKVEALDSGLTVLSTLYDSGNLEAPDTSSTFISVDVVTAALPTTTAYVRFTQIITATSYIDEISAMFSDDGTPESAHRITQADVLYLARDLPEQHITQVDVLFLYNESIPARITQADVLYLYVEERPQHITQADVLYLYEPGPEQFLAYDLWEFAVIKRKTPKQGIVTFTINLDDPEQGT